jgi:hypothetical protein
LDPDLPPPGWQAYHNEHGQVVYFNKAPRIWESSLEDLFKKCISTKKKLTAEPRSKKKPRMLPHSNELFWSRNSANAKNDTVLMLSQPIEYISGITFQGLALIIANIL